MVEAIQLKVCGLTTAADAAAAAAAGADFLGFITFPGSPRYLPVPQFRALSAGLPRLPWVGVAVEPTPDALRALRDAGFAKFQVHFRHDLPFATVEAWAAAVGAEHLWLAPKLPPVIDVAPEWRALAGTLLLDTFDARLFGGTGRVGDWGKFRRHRESAPDRTWILSGGLDAGNVGMALRHTGATFVDVNSGIESAPGSKDPAKLAAFVAALRAAGPPA
jgi:phosphoribosylanthranilate isomerase